MTPEPPQLPGFRQLDLLRRGRSTAVYRAQQQHPDRWVAITVFDVHLTERAAAEQFRAEARAIGRLTHPGIVPVHGADVLPDARPYLVTELCEGSLADRIAARGRLDPHEVTAVGLVVGRALLHAHDAGVRHGDLTPAGVRLRDGAVPVLAGFELAVLCDYRDASEPTPAHAAPETVRADGAVDERTDVYGLGSILFTALAGTALFPTRRGEQEQDRLARILLDEPPAAPGPAWLADLVRTMLAKDPAARPTLHRVVDLLAAEAAEDAGPRESPPREGAADAHPAVPDARPQAGRHASPWALTAACLAVLVAVVAGVLLVWPAVG
ncbi:MAG TPA: serine/threonine-protein kinase [Pseudonocardia sp.]|nr:serine/threonine-protein kinase [Pseudonocardia sp.]